MNKEHDKLFFIRHDKYVGNAVVWWAKNSTGYTTDIRKAQLYTYNEAKRICENRPNMDFAYYAGDILQNERGQKLIYEAQYLDRDMVIKFE